MLRAADIRNQLQRHVRYLTHLTLSDRPSLCTLLKLPNSPQMDPFPPVSHRLTCDAAIASVLVY